MSFEPRMRGRRFGRPAARRPSAKSKREPQESSIFYEEAAKIDPAEIRSSTLNSLQHLGNQRFALPPFSEHFQRWMKDVKGVLTDFENQLPQIITQNYSETVAKTLGDIKTAFDQQIESEGKISDETARTQRQLAACESELSRHEHEYKAMTNQVKKRYELSFEKLRGEIDTLDRQRIRILHAKPTLLQKLFRRSDTKLEEKTNALQSKRNDLGGRKDTLEHDLEKVRIGYEQKRKQLIERAGTLRARMSEVKGKTLDDALELRRHACEEIIKAVIETVDKFLKARNPQNIEGTQQAV